MKLKIEGTQKRSYLNESHFLLVQKSVQSATYCQKVIKLKQEFKNDGNSATLRHYQYVKILSN